MIFANYLTKTVRRSAVLRLEQAGKALGGIEVEVLLAYYPFEAQEVLHTSDLHHRIGD